MIPLLKPNEFYEKNYSSHYRNRNLYKHQSDTFEVHRIEDHIKAIQFPLKPHRKTVSDFLLVTSGQITKHKNVYERVIRNGQVFLLPRFQIGSTLSLQGDVKGYYCHFDYSQILSISNTRFSIYNSNHDPLIQLNSVQLTAVTNMLERLIDIKDKRNSDQVIFSYIISILHEFQYASMCSNDDKPSTSTLCDRFENLLFEEVYTLHKVSDFSKKLGVSPNHLNKTVNKRYSKSVKAMITEVKLREAQVLLKQSDYSVSQIADIVFNMSGSDFARLFKRNLNVTPASFRACD